ncbi:deoxynucleotide monophosphate kinase family protein [Streptomyces halstedii]|uniref:deoxynucleotide monophosphate kinase family protein n=1 Tax=Streptomyces halstedii TaxID=1944 RepID=UPI003698C11A
MTYRHIALMGRAGSGKDTVGNRLVSRFAFARIAFADPLRDLALSLDPVISYETTTLGPLPLRLGDFLRRSGWDGAKRIPEVRRTLQRLGQGVRDQDEGYWLRAALARLDVADRWGLPVVVTDCRYENEAEALRARGALLVRVERPDRTAPAGDAAEHRSETELDHFPADAVITNGGTVAELHALADQLVIRR